jgi:tetratricopeptide (TPR) repeat protein
MTQPANPEEKLPRALVVMLVLVPLFLFARATQFPYTNWDDPQFIVNNPCLTWSLDHLAAIWKPGGVPGEMIYIPITYCSYLIDDIIAGRAAAWVHTVNVLLHAINTAFVCLLCCRLRLPRAGIVVATLLFALHPVQVEPVAWAMGRKDLLSACFGLAAILVHLARPEASPTGRRRIAVVLLGALAMLAKPSMIILPVLLLVLDCWEGGGLTRARIKATIPLFVLAVIVLGLDTMMPNETNTAAPAGTVYRLMCLPVVAWGWFQRLICLAPVCPLYGWPPAIAIFAILPGILLIVAGAILIFVKRDRRMLGLIFAVVAIAPAVSIVLGAREFITGDRYGYLALVGIGIWCGSYCKRRWWIGLCAAWLLLCGVGTVVQIPVWSASERVWQQVLQQYPENALAHNNLALTYVEKGQLDLALEVAAAGFVLAPDDATLATNYGRILLGNDVLDTALTVLHTAVDLDEHNAKAWKIIGDIHIRRYLDRPADLHLGDVAALLEAAAAAYSKAIAIDGGYVDAYIGLGSAYRYQGDLNAAGTTYFQALQLGSNDAELYFHLGIVHTRQGSTKSAVDAYEKSVQLSGTTDPNTIYNLARAYESDGRGRDAIMTYESLLRLQPDHVEGMINAARIYQLSGMPEKAMALYDRALTISPAHAAGIHLNRGLILRGEGKLDEAETACLAALAADPVMGPVHEELANLYDALGQPDKAAFHRKNAIEQ